MKINVNLLRAIATVIDMARQHIEDIESGIDDGTYCASENEDLPSKKASLSEAMQFLDIQRNTLAEDDDPNWLRTLKVGSKVWWNDPDDNQSSGIYEITSMRDDVVVSDVLLLTNDAGSVVEVSASELSPMSEATIQHYLIVVEGDVEPFIKGPFESFDLVQMKAQEHRDGDPDLEDGLYPLAVYPKGRPTISSFSGGDLEDLEADSES